jgi:hypothetical protein
MVTATRKHSHVMSSSKASRDRIAREMSEIRHGWSGAERSSRLTRAIEAQGKLLSFVLGVG